MQHEIEFAAASSSSAGRWLNREEAADKWPHWLPDGWLIGRHSTHMNRYGNPRQGYKCIATGREYSTRRCVEAHVRQIELGESILATGSAAGPVVVLGATRDFSELFMLLCFPNVAHSML